MYAESSYQEGFNHLIEFSSDLTKLKMSIEKHEDAVMKLLDEEWFDSNKFKTSLSKIHEFIGKSSDGYEALIGSHSEDDRIRALGTMETAAKSLKKITNQFIDDYKAVVLILDEEFNIGLRNFMQAIFDYWYESHDIDYSFEVEWISNLLNFIRLDKEQKQILRIIWDSTLGQNIEQFQDLLEIKKIPRGQFMNWFIEWLGANELINSKLTKKDAQKLIDKDLVGHELKKVLDVLEIT